MIANILNVVPHGVNMVSNSFGALDEGITLLDETVPYDYTLTGMGVREFENVGRTLKDNKTPVVRERRALEDLDRALTAIYGKNNYDLEYTAYD